MCTIDIIWIGHIQKIFINRAIIEVSKDSKALLEFIILLGPQKSYLESELFY